MGTFSIDRISPVFVRWHDSSASPHSSSSDSYGRRVVEHYELEYIVSSHSGYILTEEMPLPALPGNLFFRFPGMVVEGIGVYHSLYIEFEMNAEGDRLENEEALPYRCGENGPRESDEALFYSLRPPKASTPAHTFRTKARILELLARLMEQAEENGAKKPEGEQAQKIRSALRYVQLHYMENITESEMAQAAGYSVYYFCRLFKRLTQLTPMQYVVRYRIEKARVRLLTTDEPVEIIMEKTGFHHYSYFWRVFKRVYGCSPWEYRKGKSGSLDV